MKMAFLQKLMNSSKQARHLCTSLSSLNFGQTNSLLQPVPTTAACKVFVAQIHSTLPRYDLMEFFDDPKNWSANEVRTGRSWKSDELRIKSNSDLHKLWFVLLKERNMLLTMEHECDAKWELFPTPERLDRVEESMRNLEQVVRERNRAYHTLETGRDGERPGRIKEGVFGLEEFYSEIEHKVPRERHEAAVVHATDVRKFLRLYREKQNSNLRKEKNRNRNHVTHLLRRFPNLDRDLLQRKYPEVNIEKIDRCDKARGHYVPVIEK